MQPKIKGWWATVDGKTQDVQNQRYLDETEALLTVEELHNVCSSKPYGEGQKVIRQAVQGKKLSEQEFTTARDFIVACFLLDCATWPGPINNATLLDYEAAET